MRSPFRVSDLVHLPDLGWPVYVFTKREGSIGRVSLREIRCGICEGRAKKMQERCIVPALIISKSSMKDSEY